MLDTTQNIGVVGGGISGITTAWLLSRRYSVTLIEKEPQLGGHTHTHCLDSGPDDLKTKTWDFIIPAMFPADYSRVGEI
jgi:predicted NAD/FAD-binding protein